jgi:hypothetical protein
MLWLGLLQRDTGVLASDWLGIQDEVVAFDFSRAVTLRLLRFDNEKDQANRKFWVRMVGGTIEDDSVLDATEIHDVIRNDPYADENTIVS